MPIKKEDELKYAWEWFKFHADQRTKVFHFYLLTTGALLYGLISIYLAGDKIPKEPVIFILSILGVASSVAFYLLEKRNEELVNCGRQYLEANKHQAYLLDVSRDKFSLSIICFESCAFIKYAVTHSFVFKTFIYLVGVF